jgi:hypothetical protein
VLLPIEEAMETGCFQIPIARKTVVVAGPSTSMTIPGIIVSQIVQALLRENQVTRIEVDLGTDFAVGLHRAPLLAGALVDVNSVAAISHRAPKDTRLRNLAFREWITTDMRSAIAFVWPGIDNSWIRQFLSAAKRVGVSTTVVCASLPKSDRVKNASLVDNMVNADHILVGDASDAFSLGRAFGSAGPKIDIHRALMLRGKRERSGVQQITAFLPKDNAENLSSLLAAFDAIPEAWIDQYCLKIAMRTTGSVATEMVSRSYHAEYVQLLQDDFSAIDLEKLCLASSALIVADPAFDSRAYTFAVECGVATVVLASAPLPDVGHGYVGGLLADLNNPISIHVALLHALRLAELRFPTPRAWDELAESVVGSPLEILDVGEQVFQN